MESLIRFSQSAAGRYAFGLKLSIAKIPDQSATQIKLPQGGGHWQLVIDSICPHLYTEKDAWPNSVSRELGVAFSAHEVNCYVHCECALIEFLTKESNAGREQSVTEKIEINGGWVPVRQIPPPWCRGLSSGTQTAAVAKGGHREHKKPKGLKGNKGKKGNNGTKGANGTKGQKGEKAGKEHKGPEGHSGHLDVKIPQGWTTSGTTTCSSGPNEAWSARGV